MLHLSLGADAGESLSPHFLEALQITDLSLVISRLHQVIDSFFWLSFYTGAVILQDRVCLSACQPFAPCAARGELLQKKHAMRALCARCRRPSDRPGGPPHRSPTAQAAWPCLAGTRSFGSGLIRGLEHGHQRVLRPARDARWSQNAFACQSLGLRPRPRAPAKPLASPAAPQALSAGATAPAPVRQAARTAPSRLLFAGQQEASAHHAPVRGSGL